MPRKSSTPIAEPLEPLILTIRGQRVILDTDLARLYGVETRALNQSVKRNAERFPADFAFQLTLEEAAAALQSSAELEIASGSNDGGGASNSSQIVMSSRRHRGTPYRPWAFTEHGALMASNIVRSDQAVQMSVFVVRAFVRLRDQALDNAAILKRLAEIDRSLLQHDQSLSVIWHKLQPLLQPPPVTKPKRRIGFRPGDDE